MKYALIGLYLALVGCAQEPVLHAQTTSRAMSNMIAQDAVVALVVSIGLIILSYPIMRFLGKAQKNGG